MPKTALHFGAGNIGRGFITPILQENGYEVALVDVDSDLVNKLNLIPSKHRTNGPSRYYEYSNHKSKIGIISAISHNFCDTCNRVRLTCTGKLYMCLGQNDFVDLKFALRNQTKNDIIALIEYAMSIKPKAHNFEIQKDNFEGYVNRYMNETGG